MAPLSRPLAGRRVVNTRAAHQAAELDRLLRAEGAEPLAYPCLQFAVPADPRLEAAWRALAEGRFDWVVLTSANAAQAVAEGLGRVRPGRPPALPGRVRVAAVGPATARSAQELLGVEAAWAPPRFRAGELLGAPFEAGARVLWPRSALASDDLARLLAGAGLRVTSLEAYRVVPGAGGVDLPRLLRSGEVDALTFASPSAVEFALLRVSREGGSAELLRRAPAFCIGEATAGRAAGAGLPVAGIAEPHTAAGLVASLVRHFASHDAKRGVGP